MERNRLYVGCDNAAVDFKNTMVAFMRDLGYDVVDMGIADSADGTAYPLIAEKVAAAVVAESGSRGVLICGTGIGMSMAANKVPGVRAALIHDCFSAERAALSNDANVVTMGARVIGIELAKKIMKEWLPLQFKDGPSTSKVQAIMDVEKKYMRA